jgi:Methyltransferase domain
MLIFHLLRKNRCKRAVGVDLSSKMVAYANILKKRGNFQSVDFYHMNAVNLSDKIDERFDYAIATYVLHELPENIRHYVLDEMKKVAREIIIDEYVAPQPKLLGILNWLMEISAGKKHYSNYRNFIESGGIDVLLSQHSLKIKQKITLWNAYVFIKAAMHD